MQSVAVRLIVERERERMAFRSATWWDLLGLFAKSDGQSLEATLVSVDGRKIRAYRFANDSTQTKIGFVLVDKREYQLLCEMSAGATDPDGACATLFATFRTS